MVGAIKKGYLRRLEVVHDRLSASLSRGSGVAGRSQAPGGSGPQEASTSGSSRAGDTRGSSLAEALSKSGDRNFEEIIAALEATSELVSRRNGEVDLLVARLAGALDHIDVGIVVADERSDVVYRNAAARVLENSRGGDMIAENAVSQALVEAQGGERPERTLELFSPTRHTVSIRAYPMFASTGKGEDLSAGLRLISGGSDVVGAVAVIEDISERRRLDDVRRDFVANVTHELKTPIGALSLLAETLDGEDDPEVVTRLSARVATEAGRLSKIIDELLDLSRIEVNDTPASELISIHRLVGDAVGPLRSSAEVHGIDLVVGEAPASLSVLGDRRDLVSAVGNLVDNGLKYSENGGRVSVSVTSSEGWIDISVSDTGIGIPSRDLERIFERFYRVDRARSRSTGGTGLGLSIVRHIANNHHGSVAVRSVEGEGSTFTLRLPTATPHTPAIASGGVG